MIGNTVQRQRTERRDARAETAAHRNPRVAMKLMAFGLVGMAVLGSGCQHEALAQKRLHVHQRSMESTLKQVAKSEQTRAPNLQRTWSHIEGSWQRDVRHSRENGPEAEAIWQWHTRAWNRNSRLYGPEAARILFGRPERVEPNAIILCY